LNNEKNIIAKLVSNQFRVDIPQKPKGMAIIGVEIEENRIFKFNPEGEKISQKEVFYRMISPEDFFSGYLQYELELKDITENYIPIIAIKNMGEEGEENGIYSE